MGRSTKRGNNHTNNFHFHPLSPTLSSMFLLLFITHKTPPPPQARKLESDLDIKIAAYGKLCTSYEYGYTKGEAGLATDQALESKSSEIESLLSRLDQVNSSMNPIVATPGDPRSHTFARHNDILSDFSQEFRRLKSVVAAARERASLLGGGASPSSPIMPNQSGTGLLLRERGLLAGANSALDDVMGMAQGVATGLGQQRTVFDEVGGKLAGLGAKFPVVNSLMNAIRRRKNRDNTILAAVVAVCTLLILIYWVNK